MRLVLLAAAATAASASRIGRAVASALPKPFASPLERYNVAREIEKANREAANAAHPSRKLQLALINPNLRLPGNHGNAGVDPINFKCSLDAKVTLENVPFFHSDIQRMWGSACGRNRGIFVLSPSDGHTYGCGNLPTELGVGPTVQGVTDPETPSANSVKALEVIIEAIYNTSTTKDAGACDFDAMSMLTCGREEPWRTAPWYNRLKAPIRAVNIGGLFVLERWITPGFVEWGNTTGIIDQYTFSEKCEALGICSTLQDHWKTFYSLKDFQTMKDYGLNAIRLPVGWWYFADKAGVDPGPYLLPPEDLYDPDHPITNVMRWARDTGIMVILDLHGAPGSQNGLDNSGRAAEDPDNIRWGESWLYSPQNMADTIKVLAAIAEYINRMEDMFGLDNVLALELLNEPWAYLDMGMVRDFYFTGISAVRLVRPHLPVLLHDAFRGPLWTSLLKNFPYKDVYMDTHIYHGFNPSDSASDNEEADRQKNFVHEQMSCGYSSMLRYQTCAALPTIVGEWSLAIDNCMKYLDPKFQDFGQCARIEDRLNSSWWTTHIRSFAMRQISMFERELGWAFWCWKVDDYAIANDPSSAFWSFQMAVEHDYIDIRYSTKACLHPPAEDYSLSPSPQAPAAPVPADDDDALPDAPSNSTKTDLAVRPPTVNAAASGSRLTNFTAAMLALLAALALIMASAGAAGAARRRGACASGVAGAGAGERAGLYGPI